MCSAAHTAQTGTDRQARATSLACLSMPVLLKTRKPPEINCDDA